MSNKCKSAVASPSPKPLRFRFESEQQEQNGPKHPSSMIDLTKYQMKP